MAKNGKWTVSEEDILMDAAAKYGVVKDWKDISSLLPGRTRESCRSRYFDIKSKNKTWAERNKHNLEPEKEKRFSFKSDNLQVRD